MGPNHPEQPARLEIIESQLAASELASQLQRYNAPVAEREALARVHTAGHIDSIFAADPLDELHWLDPDTAMNPHSLDAALRAAGANLLGVDLVLGGEVDKAFCAVRPPGHHAERHRPMGFCLFNNVAVAAAHALDNHGLERVAIIDFDVHHGNGTEDWVGTDERILLCSSFQHPFYPHSGFDTVAPNILNLPLPAGTGGRAWRQAVSESWFAALDRFAPQLVLVSAGFDAHRDDPLGQFELLEEDFAWISAYLADLAQRHAGGRLVSTLEGGYNLHALASSVVAHLQHLQPT